MPETQRRESSKDGESQGHGGRHKERIGNYIVGAEIGRGSFATVYKGYRSVSHRETEGGRVADAIFLLLHRYSSLCFSNAQLSSQKTRDPIAIKAVSRQKLTTKLLENLESEINILKAINHRNITALEECFVSLSSTV